MAAEKSNCIFYSRSPVRPPCAHVKWDFDLLPPGLIEAKWIVAAWQGQVLDWQTERRRHFQLPTLLHSGWVVVHPSSLVTATSEELSEYFVLLTGLFPRLFLN